VHGEKKKREESFGICLSSAKRKKCCKDVTAEDGGLEEQQLLQRPTEQDIQQEYVKAIDHLTIFTENKLRAEVKELQSKLGMESKLRDELKKEIYKEFEREIDRGNGQQY
jgi:hypothetical protein